MPRNTPEGPTAAEETDHCKGKHPKLGLAYYLSKAPPSASFTQVANAWVLDEVPAAWGGEEDGN